MKVYIVQSCDYDDTTIHSVHASREAVNAEKQRRDDAALREARQMEARMIARHPTRKPVSDEMIEMWRDHCMVSEWEVIP